MCVSMKAPFRKKTTFLLQNDDIFSEMMILSSKIVCYLNDVAGIVVAVVGAGTVVAGMEVPGSAVAGDSPRSGRYGRR